MESDLITYVNNSGIINETVSALLTDGLIQLTEAMVQPGDGLSASEEREKVFATMTFVSLSCNIFTLVLSYIMIYRLVEQIWNAKRNRELKRRKLYFYSALFVSLNFA